MDGRMDRKIKKKKKIKNDKNGSLEVKSENSKVICLVLLSNHTGVAS